MTSVQQRIEGISRPLRGLGVYLGYREGNREANGEENTKFDGASGSSGSKVDAKNELQNYLYGIINRNKDPMGERTLKHWLQSPLKLKSEIDSRLDLVEVFISNASVRNSLRDGVDKLHNFQILNAY